MSHAPAEIMAARFDLVKAAVPTMIKLLHSEGNDLTERECVEACIEFADAVLAALGDIPVNKLRESFRAVK